MNFPSQKKKTVLTIGLIVKNEEKNLPVCLDRLEPIRAAVPCTVIITDTGSTDGTKEIAKARADIYKEFVWCNDFAAARNTTLENPESDWYMYIDADEHCENPEPIIEFFSSGMYKKYDCASIIINNELSNGAISSMTSNRLARFDPNIHFEGYVHEQFKIPKKKPFEIKSEFSHRGYVQEVIRNKHNRNRPLLYKKLTETQDVFVKIQTYLELGDSYSYSPFRAINQWEKGLELSQNFNIFTTFIFLVRIENRYSVQKKHEKVLETHERYNAARAKDPTYKRLIYPDIEDAYHTGLALTLLGRYEESFEILLRFAAMMELYREGGIPTSDNLYIPAGSFTKMSKEDVLKLLGKVKWDMEQKNNAANSGDKPANPNASSYAEEMAKIDDGQIDESDDIDEDEADENAVKADSIAADTDEYANTPNYKRLDE